jgi:hypothetical protein
MIRRPAQSEARPLPVWASGRANRIEQPRVPNVPAAPSQFVRLDALKTSSLTVAVPALIYRPDHPPAGATGAALKSESKNGSWNARRINPCEFWSLKIMRIPAVS